MNKHLSTFGLVGLVVLGLGYFLISAPQEASRKDALLFSNTGTWDDGLLAISDQETRYPKEIFASIILTPPPINSSAEAFTEITVLKSYRDLRSAEKIEDIVSENEPETLYVGKYSLVEYTDGTFPATAQLLKDSYQDVTVITLREKKLFDRVRPSILDATIDTVVPVPGHPAYPSGHSTQQHFVAYVLSELDPLHSADYISRADEIAKNREIAGLHYQSDTRAGVELAKQFFDIMMQNEKFQTLLAAAKVEWTTNPALQGAPANP